MKPTYDQLAERSKACMDACANIPTYQLYDVGGVPFDIAAALDSYRASNASLAERVASLEAVRHDFAKWISQNPPKFGGDHACARCYPQSDLIKAGFVCAYHAALDVLTPPQPVEAAKGGEPGAWKSLADKAIAVLNRHIVPGGISDKDALSELYGIVDGPDYRAASQAADAQPVAWVRETELAKLADPRVAGVGMMMHKDSGANLVPVYRHPSPTVAPASESIDCDWFTTLLDDFGVAYEADDEAEKALAHIAIIERVDAHTAGQVAASKAPVAEWISVQDRLPEVGVLVLVYWPPGPHDYQDQPNYTFDCIDENDDEHKSWWNHNEHYEHFCCVAKPEGSVGPSEKAPYTHWAPLTPPAMTNASEGGEHA